MSVAAIPNRHFRKPRARNPRPTLCVGTTADPGRVLGGKRLNEPFGPEWLPLAPRRAITTPETALAAAAVENCIVEFLGILAVRLGIRRQLPNGLRPENTDDIAHTYETAERFLFGPPGLLMYDFECCCAALGADPDAIRTCVRAAAARLGDGTRQPGSGKRRRRARVVPVAVEGAPC